jgi:hypothetical protein
LAIERKWVYARIASPGEANGRTCIFCHQLIRDESQPGHWELKAEEDDADTDYIVEDGFAHHACTQTELAKGRRSSFTLPDVPDIPRRS